MESRQNGNSDLIRVVIADDHEAIRQGVRVLLERAGEIELVAEADDAEAARVETIRLRPDVLVIDLNMPGAPIMPLISDVQARSPGTAVVMLTMQDDRHTRDAAFRHGVAEFVAKPEAAEKLVPAIHGAAHRVRSISRPFAQSGRLPIREA